MSVAYHLSQPSTCTHACTSEDVKAMIEILQQAKPFQYQPGRLLHSFPNITKSPVDPLDVAHFNTCLTNHKHKRFSGVHDFSEAADDKDLAESDGEKNTSEDDLDD